MTKIENINTKLSAYCLADHYLSRLNSGEFDSFNQMRLAICSNVVNSEYGHKSNLFIEYLWERIHKKTN